MRPVRLTWPAAALIVLVLRAGAAAAQSAPPDSTPSPGPAPADSAIVTSDTLAIADTAAAIAPRDTLVKPGVVQRARRAAGNFASDAWTITKYPFTLRGRDLLWAALAVGAGAAIYANDQAILDASIRNREAPVYREALDVGEAVDPVGLMGRTNPIYIGALVAGYVFDVRPLRTLATEILESHLLAGGVRNVLKPIVGRRHPYDNVGPYEFTFAKGTSFPSGHTSVMFELATIATLNTHSLPVGIVAYSAATAGALQRIESRNHWPSDVYVAAIYGTLISRMVVRLHEAREAERDPRTTIAPELSSDGRLRVRVTRRF